MAVFDQHFLLFFGRRRCLAPPRSISDKRSSNLFFLSFFFFLFFFFFFSRPPSQKKIQMARTQKNKATSGHLGMLKAKLAKLRRELLDPPGGGGGGGGAARGDGFDVNKVGDARVGLVGFPSVGKSTLLNKLTGTFSEVAAYEFTTLTCVPGVIRYRGAKIQLLDLPGIIEGAKDGKGRGRQVISTARTCNLILIVLDCLKPLTHKRLIEHELEGFGIRLNKRPPAISFRKKERGGVALTCTAQDSKLDLDTVKAVLSEYKVHNADVHVRDGTRRRKEPFFVCFSEAGGIQGKEKKREKTHIFFPHSKKMFKLFLANCDVDDLVDVIEGSRVYIPAIYTINKVDQISLEELQVMSRLPHYCPVSSCFFPSLFFFFRRPRGISSAHFFRSVLFCSLLFSSLLSLPIFVLKGLRLPRLEPRRPRRDDLGVPEPHARLHQAQGQAPRLERARRPGEKGPDGRGLLQPDPPRLAEAVQARADLGRVGQAQAAEGREGARAGGRGRGPDRQTGLKKRRKSGGKKRFFFRRRRRRRRLCLRSPSCASFCFGASFSPFRFQGEW